MELGKEIGQRLRVGGFDDMMIETGFPRAADIAVLAVARQSDQKDVLCASREAQAAGHFVAVHARQADVQQHDLGLKAFHRFQRRGTGWQT